MMLKFAHEGNNSTTDLALLRFKIRCEIKNDKDKTKILKWKTSHIKIQFYDCFGIPVETENSSFIEFSSSLMFSDLREASTVLLPGGCFFSSYEKSFVRAVLTQYLFKLCACIMSSRYPSRTFSLMVRVRLLRTSIVFSLVLFLVCTCSMSYVHPGNSDSNGFPTVTITLAPLEFRGQGPAVKPNSTYIKANQI